MWAEQLEETYYRYQKLREIALEVYPNKIGKDTTYEEVCKVVLFLFDRENQQKVAELMGISREQLLQELTLLNTGARLQSQEW